jgi:asparagine synthase (glutamine-hydrolysing)
MGTSYLGGIWLNGPTDRRIKAPSPDLVHEDWGWMGEAAQVFLRGAAQCSRLFTYDALAILIRGYARPRGSSGPLDLERLADELRVHYLEQGTLAVDDLDGSFTVALLDGQVGRIVLYRSLIGAGFTYYHPTPNGLLFGGNLAELVRASATMPRANHAVLPAFFLYRCVPGHETLFLDHYRLLPGEQLTWQDGRTERRQRHTFADLTESAPSSGDFVESLERTMSAVLLDCAVLRPGAANLLSGGVDSSYIQAVWNRTAMTERLPNSYSLSVDHPHTWLDTDYALTAAQALGCRHNLVPADEPYLDYLLDALGSTGEPPNHVQSAYFGRLARAMQAQGVTAGLCGEGADSLFGLGVANHVHNAAVLRRLVPFSPLRRLGGWLTRTTGADRLAYTFQMANLLSDFSAPKHPVNTVASFTEPELVEACFGTRGIEQGMTLRRELLDRFAVPADPMHRLHAMGFLGEAMDSAGLWTTMFNRAGTDLLCPFLDSRILRFSLSLPPSVRYPFRRPKELLKRALARHVPESMARRAKLGFGQPIFQWLAPGGQLRDVVEKLSRHEFIDAQTLERARQRPGWFLYSLLCYDLWHRMFIDRTLPQREPAVDERAGSSVSPLR